jgi:hypothetical protein
MTNDNPTSAEQMQSIRKKEAESRENFHPTGESPGGSTRSSGARRGG